MSVVSLMSAAVVERGLFIDLHISSRTDFSTF